MEDGYLNTGMYERVFDGNNLTSGMYFARFEAEGEVKVQKMLLIK